MKLSSQSLLHACCILFSLVFSCFLGLAQEHNLNQFYNSSFVPLELNTTSRAKLEELMILYKKEHNIVGELTPPQNEFVYRYHYFQEKLNKSGKVYYGDEISLFLNKIKNSILANRPEKERIKIYLTDYSDFNAFTNDFGSIYVNVATVAKADNVMELFGIIAHEIAHVLQHHSFQMANINEHLSSNKIEDINIVDDFEIHKFSRNQELEADSLSFVLLNDLGIDVALLESLFEKLTFSANPIYPIPIELENIWSNHHIKNYADSLNASIPNGSLYMSIIQEEGFELLSTHPTAQQRKEKYLEIFKRFNRDKEYKWQEEFGGYKDLAAFVLVKTLLTDGDFIEALYLTEQLLTKYPGDEYLRKTKQKLLLLIAQSKYLLRENPIVNMYGESCSDEAYLKFRYGILRIPALEMNIISILELENTLQTAVDPYFFRLLDFSNQLFYKYNPNLISTLNGNYIVDTMKSYSEISYAFDRLNFHEADQLAKLKKDQAVGYKYSLVYCRGEELVNQFRKNFTPSKSFNKSVLAYKKRRDQYESELTIDEFILDFNPKTSISENKKGVFVQNRPFESNTVVALVQSDTYVLQLDNKILEPNLQQTLVFEEYVNEAINLNKIYDIQISNGLKSDNQISCRENYLHNLTYKWISECQYFEDLVYSVADEEIQQWIQNEKVSTLAYNINILFGEQEGKYESVHYDVFFDVNNMSVVFVSKISQNNKLSASLLRGIFIESFNGRKIK